jgi:hypothetical protein
MVVHLDDQKAKPANSALQGTRQIHVSTTLDDKQRIRQRRLRLFSKIAGYIDTESTPMLDER